MTSRFVRVVLYTLLTAVIISPFVPKKAAADLLACTWGATCAPGTLHVYMLVNNNQTQTHDRVPNDFTVTVQSQNAAAASFPGSQSGTTLTAYGQYAVSVLPLAGFEPTYSVGCNNTVFNGQEATCVITMNETQGYSSAPQPYPYPYAVALPLACVTMTPTVNLGQTATFTAVGGTGPYNWSEPFQSYQAIGPTLNVSFPGTGVQNVTVTNGSQTATCTVSVVASGAPVSPEYVASQPGYAAQPPSPTVISTYIPKLPNTGFAPLTRMQMTLAFLLLLATGAAAAPYVRKAFIIALA